MCRDIDGGTIWLGGPALLSLCLHGMGCIAVSALLSRGLHHLAKRLADAVRYILAVLVLRRDLAPAIHVHHEPVTMAQFLDPLIERLQGRAPPLPAV